MVCSHHILRLNMRPLLILLVSCLSSLPVQLAAQKGVTVVATGEILNEGKQVLELNTAPCAASPEKLGFVRPWKKTVLGEKQCPKDKKGKVRTYVEVQVEQLEGKAPKNSGETAEQPSAHPTEPKTDDKPPAAADRDGKPDSAGSDEKRGESNPNPKPDVTNPDGSKQQPPQSNSF